MDGAHRRITAPRGLSVEPGAMLGGKGQVGLARARRNGRPPVLQEGSPRSAFPDPRTPPLQKGAHWPPEGCCEAGWPQGTADREGQPGTPPLPLGQSRRRASKDQEA